MASTVTSAPPADAPPRATIAALLDAALDKVIAELHERIASGGYGDIRPVHGCVFRFVRPEGTRITDMAEQAGLTKQTVGEVVDDLEALGYVKRAPDPSDRRAKLVLLTPEGQRAQDFALEAFAEIEAGWAGRFGAKRVAVLRELLDEIVAGD
jgi:DNA-binding MarR family transcriptional regulator